MKHLLCVFFLLTATGVFGQSWEPAGNKIKTIWGEQLNPENVLPEYPRPIMEREKWLNLNGLWKFAIRPKNEPQPASFEKKILVPFAVESSLSGLGLRVTENDALWYQRTFNLPREWNGSNILLHFGGSDWQTSVWVNNIKVGEHQGAYTPFYFDITPALKKNEPNEITVRVWDPTDKGPQPRGKQVSNPEGVWYTPVSGIWQTVWVEPVNANYICALKTTPDIDKNQVIITTETPGSLTDALIEVQVKEGGKTIARAAAVNGQQIIVPMPANVKLWSPETPQLYQLEVTLTQQHKVLDKISSYVAMRKYSYKRDARGILRFQLNNKDQFQLGPLDQGWWPDGLYTAPSDEALRYDIQKTKDLGFNMIRKHIKVEPARWYTHCDQLGIIVWQDMPSGDKNFEWQNRNYFNGAEPVRTPESAAIFKKEWKEVIDFLYSYPCIGVWVPFNEAWGQFNTCEIASWTKQYDPTRPVNPASGGNFYTCGDILDLHNYPHPEMYLFDAQRVNVLGEFGGIGQKMDKHLWEPEKNWGYIDFKNSDESTTQYEKYAQQLLGLIGTGFSAAVYTQTTDVEIEVNGLMTYDRKVVKFDEKRLYKINQQLVHSLNQSK